MTKDELLLAAEKLEARILNESGPARLAMRPEFARVVSRMRGSGLRVPGRFRRLETVLCEEAAEEMFDNMPV
ncbi:hypothetical protein [Cribrihabitans pelagius]|uniref:hypothetical protein n=1 Tax=Cribrihabitans pelagius TaxID=1765746 RepID=UPI003B5A9E04